MTLSKLLIILLTAGLSASVFACSTTSTTNKSEPREVAPENNWTLKDHLRRATGVRVTGTGPNARVIIRGESSTANPTNQPLFIIDGQKAGNSFGQVNDMLYKGEINYIEVLPPSRTARYGMEGHFGVILIHTKSGG